MFNICIFEDEHYVNFFPLVYTRPVYELICGFTTLREKIARYFPEAKVNLHCRDYLGAPLGNSFPKIPINRITGESCLFINGRILPEKNLVAVLSKERDKEKAFFKNKELAAIRLQGEKLEKVKIILRKEPMKLSWQLNQFIPRMAKSELKKEVNLVHYLWDLVNQNATWIEKDAQTLAKLGKCSSEIPHGVHLVEKKNISIGREVQISPGVVIDAEEGPVIIGDKVKIFPQATIIGPVYIGERCVIKVGAQIYEGTTLGEVCKVGGEVEESIFYSYSNKQHHGFLGHSYLGSWINLGAGTTNSDLKNNYSSVKMFINGKLTDSNLTFVGLFMGDHSKSGINSTFNTGTVVGVCCNLFGSSFLPKFVPSFSWGGSGSFSTYKFEKFIETAKKVMARRKKGLSPAEKQMFEKIFNLTKTERKENI